MTRDYPYPISIFIGGVPARRVHWETYKKDMTDWARAHGGISRLTPVHTRFSRGWALLLDLADDRTALLANPTGNPVPVDLCDIDETPYPPWVNQRGTWTIREATVRHRVLRLWTGGARLMRVGAESNALRATRYTELELVAERAAEHGDQGERVPVIARSADYLRRWQWGGQGEGEVRAYRESNGLRTSGGEPGPAAGAWLTRVTLMTLREQREVPVIEAGLGCPPNLR
jgi:hypothetical protein